jgi:cytochrome b561
MSTTVARSTYSRVAIILHWLIGIAIIANLIGGLLHDLPPREMRGVIMGLHKATGITILVLSVARLLWRLTHRPPLLAATIKAWEKGIAHATHWIFYLLIILVPVSGWVMVSAAEKRRPLTWFGVFDIPYLPVAQDRIAAAGAGNAHELLAFVMIGLLVLHIGAALKHHYLDRDNTLARMLPLLRERTA